MSKWSSFSKQQLIVENWRKYLTEQEGGEPVIHFMDWLVEKTKRVHSKPGQGSIFAMSISQVVEKVKEIAANTTNVEEIANSTGVISENVPGVGYDLVVRVVDGKPIDKMGDPIEGKIITVKKEEGRGTVPVQAVRTNRPLTDFDTDKLTIIVRPMKDSDEKVLPNQYIILSAFPGTTGADKRASEWEGEYMVVIPAGKRK